MVTAAVLYTEDVQVQVLRGGLVMYIFNSNSCIEVIGPLAQSVRAANS